MTEYLSNEDILEWLDYHEIDGSQVINVEIDTDTAKHGCMRVISYATIGDNRKMAAGYQDALTEERIVRLKAMPGEIISQEVLKHQLRK